MSEKNILPEYDAPPIDEVAIGVSFAPVAGLKVPHFGLYWETIRNDYPGCEVQPPVPALVEPISGLSSFQFINDPNAVRCWFLDATGQNLIQIQPDRFIINWRQVGSGGAAYPRYINLRPAFQQKWDGFNRFLVDNAMGPAQTTQCELTYVNEIEKGEAWQSFGDLQNVIRLWGDLPDSFLTGPESVNIQLAYAFPNRPNDRLRVTIQHVIRLRDGLEALQISLVARGKPVSTATNDVLDWMDLGREWIVRAFTDITTPAMHKIWRRTQ